MGPNDLNSDSEPYRYRDKFFFYLDERGEGHLLDEELPLEVEEKEVHPAHLRHWALSWLAVALIETFTSREKTERKN